MRNRKSDERSVCSLLQRGPEIRLADLVSMFWLSAIKCQMVLEARLRPLPFAWFSFQLLTSYPTSQRCESTLHGCRCRMRKHPQDCSNVCYETDIALLSLCAPECLFEYVAYLWCGWRCCSSGMWRSINVTWLPRNVGIRLSVYAPYFYLSALLVVSKWIVRIRSNGYSRILCKRLKQRTMKNMWAYKIREIKYYAIILLHEIQYSTVILHELVCCEILKWDILVCHHIEKTGKRRVPMMTAR